MLSQPQLLTATHSQGGSALRLGLGVSPNQNGTALLALRHAGAPGRERSSRKLRSAPARNRRQLCQRNGQGSGQDRQWVWVGSPGVSGMADSLGCLSGLAGWGHVTVIPSGLVSGQRSVDTRKPPGRQALLWWSHGHTRHRKPALPCPGQPRGRGVRSPACAGRWPLNRLGLGRPC